MLVVTCSHGWDECPETEMCVCDGDDTPTTGLGGHWNTGGGCKKSGESIPVQPVQ